MHVRSPRLKAPSNQGSSEADPSPHTPSVHRAERAPTSATIVCGCGSGPPTFRPRREPETAHAGQQFARDLELLSKAALTPAPPALTPCPVCGGMHSHRCDPPSNA